MKTLLKIFYPLIWLICSLNSFFCLKLNIMTDDNVEQVEKWIEEFNELDKDLELYNFDKCKNKLHESLQISLLLFLYSKIKPENKPMHSFMHGEHDTIFIGYSSWFEDFTKEDTLRLMYHGAFLTESLDGFQIWASI